MSPSFATALVAAREAAAEQNYPPATLYMVATPIGNLSDISLRALYVLDMVDALACEDTRHTQSLLRAYGIDKPNRQLLAVHEHNEVEAAQKVIAHLHHGERLAYVSDAGTPGVSDPGARLASAVRSAGLRVLPLPGASSLTTLISAAGAASVDGGQFVFAGFLSNKVQERDRAVSELIDETRAILLLEAPHRIEALAKALAVLDKRLVTLGRELTKQFEEIVTMSANALPAWLAADPQRQRGEFALLLHPITQTAVTETNTQEGLRVLTLLMQELPLKSAVKLAADITGAARNVLYEAALKMKSQPSLED